MTAQPDRILPAHIEQTVEAIARLHADHEREATAMQRFIAKTTTLIGKPNTLALLTALIAAWVVLNLTAATYGKAVDPAPFNWMETALTTVSLYVTILILGTQQRDDVIAGYREQLTLELAILGEQKSAKIIELLESLRRDSPMIRDRIDPEATAMSMPADPQAVLEAIQDSTRETAEPGPDAQ